MTHRVFAYFIAFGQTQVSGKPESTWLSKLIDSSRANKELKDSFIEVSGEAMKSVLEASFLKIVFEGSLHGYLEGFLPLKLIRADHFYYSVGHCMTVTICAITSTIVLLLLQEIERMVRIKT